MKNRPSLRACSQHLSLARLMCGMVPTSAREDMFAFRHAFCTDKTWEDANVLPERRHLTVFLLSLSYILSRNTEGGSPLLVSRKLLQCFSQTTGRQCSNARELLRANMIHSMHHVASFLFPHAELTPSSALAATTHTRISETVTRRRIAVLLPNRRLNAKKSFHVRRAASSVRAHRRQHDSLRIARLRLHGQVCASRNLQ